MEDKVIYTPEGVGLVYSIAGIGNRFVAIMIDTFIQAFMIIITFLLLYSFMPNTIIEYFSNLSGAYIAVIIIIAFLIIDGYYIIFEPLMKGRTPGKAAMKLRVVKHNGAPAAFSNLLIRNILRIADILPVFYLAGVVIMFINDESRRLGDLAAGTIVIRDENTRLSSLDYIYNENNPDKGMFPLTHEEFRLIKDFLNRKNSFNKNYREKLAKLLADKFWDKLMIPEDQRGLPEDFLERVYKSSC